MGHHLIQELESFHILTGGLQSESQIGGRKTKTTSALSLVLNQYVIFPLTPIPSQWQVRFGIMKVQHTATFSEKACLLHVKICFLLGYLVLEEKSKAPRQPGATFVELSCFCSLFWNGVPGLIPRLARMVTSPVVPTFRRQNDEKPKCNPQFPHSVLFADI